MDTVFLKGLTLTTRIGVFAEEQGHKQELIVDLDIEVKDNLSHQTDALADTLDYASLSRRLREWSSRQDCDLLEKFAEHLCVFIFTSYPLAQTIYLTLHKPPAACALGLSDVGLKISRHRSA